jgi:hypothetical protein
MDYREADGLLFAVVGEGRAQMWATARTTQFPQTYRALFGFCVKTGTLKTGLFDMVDSNNPYAFKALFRCYCEHYLKFTYIWVRFLQEKTDDVGREFFSFCGAVESRDYLKSIVVAEGLLGNQIVGNVRAAIDNVYPGAAGLSMGELEAGPRSSGIARSPLSERSWLSDRRDAVSRENHPGIRGAVSVHPRGAVGRP